MQEQNSHNQDLGDLEAILGYQFNDRSLLVAALTHSSFGNEQGVGINNERLEFLGDAVLEVNISEKLYLQFPNEREGSLTRMRAKLVSASKLADLAEKCNLGTYLRLGKGEEAQGGRIRPSLLADAMEAVLGAFYLDGGHDRATDLLTRLYADEWPQLSVLRKGKDFKTRLQEITQGHYHALPSYFHLSSTGPEHYKIFQVQLQLPAGQIFTGKGTSMKRAEQDAARQALDFLEKG